MVINYIAQLAFISPGSSVKCTPWSNFNIVTTPHHIDSEFYVEGKRSGT